MPTCHDELHTLVDALSEDHAALLLDFALTLQGPDLTVAFWAGEPLTDWDAKEALLT